MFRIENVFADIPLKFGLHFQKQVVRRVIQYTENPLPVQFGSGFVLFDFNSLSADKKRTYFVRVYGFSKAQNKKR